MESTTTAPVAGADTDDADWVSRAQLAQLAGTSPDTVDRDIKKHKLDTRKGSKGEVQVRISDFVRIGRLAPTDVPTGLTGVQAAELRQLQADNARLIATRAEAEGRLAECRSHLELMREQLQAKDEQLKLILSALKSGR